MYVKGHTLRMWTNGAVVTASSRLVVTFCRLNAFNITFFFK